MKADELKDKIAQALYSQSATIGGQWKKEQDHVKWKWYDQAEGIIEALAKSNLEIVEKAEAPKKKTTKKLEPEAGEIVDDPFDPA